MTKSVRISLSIAIAYFLIIIPVNSQIDTGFIFAENELYTGLIISGDNELSGLETGLFMTSSSILPDQFINLSENDLDTSTTGEVSITNQIPQIIISEVYYDGTNEWIEIINIGDYFSGNIQLFISKDITIPIQLQGGQSIIITKTSVSYTEISSIVTKISTATSFSITDTKAIDVSLLRSGQKIDQFYVDTGLVTKLDNKKTSFIKLYNNQIWSITGNEFPINTTSPYIASPGLWESYDVFFGNIVIDCLTGCDVLSGSQITSGSDLGGGEMSGNVDTTLSTSPQSDILSISEIYQTDGYFSSFIEIKALQDFSGKVFISGSLLNTALSLDLSLKNQEYIIIVQFDNHRLSNQKRIEDTGLELNYSGFLYIYRQDGQVFDTIQILSTSGGKSNYNGYISTGDLDIFSKIDRFSPGFDEKYLYYLDYKLSVTTGSNISNTGFSGQMLTGTVSTTGTTIGQDMSGGFDTGWLPEYKDLEIISLSYLNPEYITVQSNIAFDLDVSSHNRYLLTKETKDSTRKTTKKYLTGMLLSGSSTQIYKTRGFLDKGSCVGLFYQSTEIDELCYGSALIQDMVVKKEIELQSEYIPDIKIIGLLPNPVGKDTQEQLHLFRTKSDTDNNQIQLNNKSLYIKINTTKKHITGSLNLNTGTIFKGSLGLVNKSACVELWYTGTLLDTFCYSDPKEGEFIDLNGTETEPQIQDIPDIKIIGLLPNPSGKDNKEELHLLRTSSITEGSALVGVASSPLANMAIQLFSHFESYGEISTNQFMIPLNSLYLKTNTTKKYLSGILNLNQETILTGSLGLLNKAHCVELRYLDNKLDKFCYANPKEDQYFGTGNYILSTIEKSDFNILQNVSFIVTGLNICVNYYDQIISCRSLPASKTSIKLKNENKLYKTYFSLFQNYLIKNRSTLYFNTDIKTYFDIFKSAKSKVSKFESSITISGQNLNIYNLSGQIQLTTAVQLLSGNSMLDQKSWRHRFLLRLGL